MCACPRPSWSSNVNLLAAAGGMDPALRDLSGYLVTRNCMFPNACPPPNMANTTQIPVSGIATSSVLDSGAPRGMNCAYGVFPVDLCGSASPDCGGFSRIAVP